MRVSMWLLCGFLLATGIAACRLDGGQAEPERKQEAMALVVAAPDAPSPAELAKRIEALSESLSHVARDAAEAHAIAREAKGTAELARDTAAASASVGEANAAALAKLQWPAVTMREPCGRPTTNARRGATHAPCTVGK